MANSILGVVVVTFSGLVGEIFGFVGYYLKSFLDFTTSFYVFVYEFFGFLDNIFWISQLFFGFQSKARRPKDEVKRAQRAAN